jgi:hypothetical protein
VASWTGGKTVFLRRPKDTQPLADRLKVNARRDVTVETKS